MGRPRKTLAELKLSGSLKHDPKRYKNRIHPPKPADGLGNAPDHLNAAQRAVWDEIAGLALPGLLGNCDRQAIELLSVLVAKFRKYGTGKRGITNRDMSIMMQIWGKIGFTPHDRSKLNLSLKQPDSSPSPYDEFIEFDKDSPTQ